MQQSPSRQNSGGYFEGRPTLFCFLLDMDILLYEVSGQRGMLGPPPRAK